ncbi:4'-phosphopantetheinyl transferase, partial [Streptomyces sp. SID10115]|nr:4'-phosphopantetheinyl transferase [Streptomyces sp. SID10115]NEA06091.1 4'-phosphopantetheinyl transferase [Streptomyces sp. SID10116]
MATLLAGVPVTVVETHEDPADAVLFPAEEAVVANAVDKRRKEFTTVRHCARTALARIGVPAAPILPGHRGAPGWPDGVVGSMTHCA